VYDGAGKQLTDFTVAGAMLAFTTAPTVPLYATWPVTVQTGQSASDIIQYGTEQYRVSRIYRVPGSGYWHCLAVRMDAA
jgi:hypothetical protein